MNWALILDYLQVFIWPVVVVIALLLFRKQIGGLLQRPPTSIQTPFGTLNYAQQSEADEISDEEAEDVYDEDADFFEAIRNEVRAEVVEEIAGAAVAAQEEVVRELSMARLNFEFERLFNRIFGSQVFLLERLRDGPKHEPFMDAWFNGVVEKYPTMGMTYSKESYLGFLLANGLAEEEVPGTYRITDKGRAFLGYLAFAGYDKGWRLF